MTVSCDDVDWFLGEGSREKLTDSVLDAPADDSFGDRCTE
jgi:hypothetical protein